jgi:cytochrome P450
VTTPAGPTPEPRRGLFGDLDGVVDRLRETLPGRMDEVGMVLQRWLDDRDQPMFSLLRRTNPIVATKQVALVTLAEDVRKVLDDPAGFSNEMYKRKMDTLLGPFILGMDATSDEYQRDVGILRSVVRPDDLPRLHDMFAQRADALLAQAQGSIDVVGNYADVLVHEVHGTYFGTPGPDRVTQLGWGRALFEEIFINVRNDVEMRAAADAAAAAAAADLDERIAQRRRQREAGEQTPDDVLGRLLDVPDGFDDAGIRNNLLGLSIGWLPTATKALALAMDELLSRPEELAGAQAAASDGGEALVARYVWEALRFRPHNSGLLRVANSDQAVAAGTQREETIPAGAVVYAATESAMSDASAVEDPDSFRVDRPDETYLHFGFGPHTCFGEAINRVQLPAMAAALLRRSGLKRLDDMSWDGLFPSRLLVGFEH